MREIHRKIASAIIRSADKKILLGKKDPAKGGVYRDCWHIPGGGVEQGESLIDALYREVREEVGIDISKATIALFDDRGRGESVKTQSGEEVLCRMEFYVYLIDLPTSAAETRIILEDDLCATSWIEPDSLRQYQLTPPSVELFSRHGWI